VKTERLSPKARELLSFAASALEEECDAAGEEETREHPTLRSHARLAARIRRYLRDDRLKGLK
jgi:hypothetical protein